MIECIRGAGGCNGWVHPSCCGLILTHEELEALNAYICPLCEKSDDDFNKMTVLNTSLANRQAKRERKRKAHPAKPVKKPWICAACQHSNWDRRTRECEACHVRRVMTKKPKIINDEAKSLAQQLRDERRHSQRSVNRKRKSYHVPNSDEDIASSDSGKHRRKEKKHKKQKRDDDSDSGEAEVQLDTSTLKHEAKSEVETVGISMVIDKIMGVRQREVIEPVASESASATLFAKRPAKTFIMEYLIKWKDFAYMHASWETKQVLLDLDPLTNKQKMKRFHEKEFHLSQYPHRQANDMKEESLALDDLEYFNPDFLEIHRIIAHRKDRPMPNDVDFSDAPIDDGMRYFIKWRILSYTDATWERACDIKDDVALAKYKASTLVPDENVWKPRPRPSIREYRKLDESPRFGEDQSLSLRAYQLEGLNWLLWNWYNERPSILADEMGLGKTIQTLAFLNVLRDDTKIKIRGPFLIVAPLSLIVQWQNECEIWTTMNCVVYHGNSASRAIIRDFEFNYMDESLRRIKKNMYRFNILVTTYEVAIKDIAILSKIHWRCLVVDEAHRLKNQSSRLVEQMRSLRRDHCILLTGTPLQNKTEELWALLNFLDSKSFPSVSDFLEKFGDLHEAQQVADLHKMLKPYLLRRVKEDVEKSLPPKEETIVEVELTPVQKQWYRAIYERNTAFLNRGGNPRNVPNLMNVMMELRKCCNHPYLNNGVEEVLNEGLNTDTQRHEMMVKCCGKMVLIDKLLPRLKLGGHKVLIFSQMVRVLDIIEDYLRYCGHLYERLDGNIRGNDRQAAVDRFVKPEYKRFVMLLSTKAGGLGLNLTAADTVIIFDSDWNPQNDLQAQARAHRIGQTHSVKIYRLITRKTYEMHMFHKASLKLGLDKAVLTHMRRENEEECGKKRNKSSKAQESKEIDELLKRGAYDVFRDDDAAGEQFCELDIDQILQRSSQIVQYTQQAQSSFSKASFVSATTSNDVDLDDPDFWKKAVGLTEPDVVESEDLLPQQRKRTRVARFGDGGNFSDGISDEEDDKEKLEKEKEERERLEEKTAPREWTQNGRDRLQRALMHYGFSRWEIIRSQSGGSRSVKDVESFARSFIYVSALACDQRKDDSPFVKASICTAALAQKEDLIDEEELPSVLKEEDFVLKSKQGGGRRVVVRLDMLQRLQQLICSACDACDELYKNDEGLKSRPCPTANIDERANYYGVDKLIPHIALIDLGERPAWTQITPWWNEDADRNLLMGVFLHGYGRCAQILADPRLYFAQSEKFARDQVLTSNVGELNRSNFCLLPAKISKKETTISAEEDDSGDISDSESYSSVIAGNSGSSHVKHEGSTAVGSDVTAAIDSFKQPEVQHMNRLLGWLLSAEETKRRQEKERSKKERVAVEQRRQVRQEVRARTLILRRLELKAMQLAQVDILRHMAILNNARQLSDVTLALASTHRIKSTDWTKDERRSFAYMMALYGAPRILAKRVVVASDGRATPSMSPFVAEKTRDFAWETDSISWRNIVEWGNLNKTAVMTCQFYETKFAPKCREVARMRADLLSSDQRAVALGDLIGIEFVDAYEGVLAHGLKARNTAWITMRRTQLLEDVLHILSTKREALEAYVKSGMSVLMTDMPLWWCPWIHDLGMFYGMARYGVYGWERIMLDRQLPFHRQARAYHFRTGLEEGKLSFHPLHRHHFESKTAMNDWFKRTVNEFPSFSILERKVEIICAAVLANSEHLAERYLEPEDRHEFSLSPPNNCFERLIVTHIKQIEELLLTIEPLLEIAPSQWEGNGDRASAALNAYFAESQRRRDEFLRLAEASSAIDFKSEAKDAYPLVSNGPN